ncbi:MAG: DUF4376 domain-containing protein [Candidatus Omnitrophica bacterium]|nr:DUF4376 domain-containing protein [Candidatus Omnitrophota bacterium]
MRHHLINGVEVPFTPEEETAQDIIDAEFEAGLLPKAIADKKEAVDALHLQKATASFAHGGRTFDADKYAQQNIRDAIQYKRDKPIADGVNRTWRLANNTTVTLTWGEVRDMGLALFERGDDYFGYASIHKDAIDALTTVTAVDAYDITINWSA